MKEFNSSFAEIDNMELEMLIDLINVYEKLNNTDYEKTGKVTYKVLD